MSEGLALLTGSNDTTHISPQVPKSSRQRANWTEAAIEALKLLHDEGATAQEMADALGGEEMGFTRNAIIGKWHRLNLPLRTDPKPRDPNKSRKQQATRRYLKAAPASESLPIPLDIFDHNIPIPQRKTLLELDRASCRWPIGEPGKPNFFYCGATTADQPYCSFHRRVAYRPWVRT